MFIFTVYKKSGDLLIWREIPRQIGRSPAKSGDLEALRSVHTDLCAN